MIAICHEEPVNFSKADGILATLFYFQKRELGGEEECVGERRDFAHSFLSFAYCFIYVFAYVHL